MRALLLAGLGAALTAGAMGGAAAQGTRPSAAPGLEENRREVRQMAEIFDIQRQAEALLINMRAEIIRATMGTSDLSEEDAARVVDEVLMPNFRARSGELVAELIDAYATNFTISDLKALRAFFGSSLGQKWLRSQPAARAQGDQAGLAWGQRVFQDSVDRHADELRARGLKF